MASALRSLLLLCGICGLLTGTSGQTLKGYCPKGWTRLNDRCLIYQHDERTFADAESVCNILGGNLVSITSRLENQVIIELIREGAGVFDETWIGAHDAVSEGVFFFTDGTPVGFTDFEADNADSLVPPEDCVDIEDGTEMWHEHECGDLSPYVCAKKVHVKKH